MMLQGSMPSSSVYASSRSLPDVAIDVLDQAGRSSIGPYPTRRALSRGVATANCYTAETSLDASTSVRGSHAVCSLDEVLLLWNSVERPTSRPTSVVVLNRART